METNQSQMRERIINAAISCIEKEGLFNLTIRSVAREAGVNSAAINYYFSSKDRLIQEVLNTTMRTGIEENIADFLSDSEADPMESLKAMLEHMLEGMINYPNLIKAHMGDMFLKGVYRRDFMERFTPFFLAIEEKIRGQHPELNAEQLKIKVMQLWSSVMMPGILPGFFSSYSALDFKDPETRRRYVETLLES
ncbi:MAG: TetR family transcriptional regulator [Spirochaetes bacterium]|nr:TetR family transcriptional regulator [Spirochaetota bacterium]